MVKPIEYDKFVETIKKLGVNHCDENSKIKV